jgi:DNA-binding winged helix-turn-helix (wHTH) protein
MVVKTAYEFGSYRLEPPTRRLLRSGEAVSLTPKAFDTLLALVERHDRVVDKAELMRIVWPDSFVEEANLSQTIFVLRKTLGEGPHGKPFIETVPRHGYRFAAGVRVEIAKPPVGEEQANVWSSRLARIASALAIVTAVGWFGMSWMGWSGDRSV